DIPVTEAPRLCPLQVQLPFDAFEHCPSLGKNDGIHHDLVFIDQTLCRQLRNNRAASHYDHSVLRARSSSFLFRPPSRLPPAWYCSMMPCRVFSKIRSSADYSFVQPRTIARLQTWHSLQQMHSTPHPACGPSSCRRRRL